MFIVAGPAAFAALGVPFAVPLAFVVAVTDLIPVIGATPGAVICVLVPLLATSVWPVTVLVAVFFVLYQQLENYLIAPRAMCGAVKLSPAAAQLAALIGGAALGLIGALMAIPVAAVQRSCCPSASRPGTRPTMIPLAKAAGVMTNVSHGPTRPAHRNHTINLPAGRGQSTRRPPARTASRHLPTARSSASA